MADAAPFVETIGEQVAVSSTTHLNVAQAFIVTTEDKVRLCLHTHTEGLAARAGWIAPVSLLITIILTLVTSDFHDSFGFPKETWRAVFLLACALVGIWSVAAGWKASRVTTSIDRIVAELRPPAVGPPVSPQGIVGRWQHFFDDKSAINTLLASGKINDENSRAVWSLKGTRLTLIHPDPRSPQGAWVDMCEVSADGRSYAGVNQLGTIIRGKKLA
jgi:hypothetical protein